jgi:hypothetical protein
MMHVYGRYCDATDVRRIERIEMFDEFEEWTLMQSHYCISIGAIDPATASSGNDGGGGSDGGAVAASGPLTSIVARLGDADTVGVTPVFIAVPTPASLSFPSPFGGASTSGNVLANLNRRAIPNAD